VRIHAVETIRRSVVRRAMWIHAYKWLRRKDSHLPALMRATRRQCAGSEGFAASDSDGKYAGQGAGKCVPCHLK
jgi:hypothetical protein